MLNIPHQKRKAFKSHFIRAAYIEFRFSSQQKIAWEEKKDELSEKFKKIGFEGNSLALETQFQIKGDSPTVPPSMKLDATVIGLDFHRAEDKSTYKILSDRVVLSTGDYHSFEKFWRTAASCCKQLEGLHNISEIVWAGIRKVNVIGVNAPDGKYRGQGFNDIFFTALRDEKIAPGTAAVAETRYVINKDNKSCLIRLSSVRQADPNNYELQIDIDGNEKFPDGLTLDKLEPKAKEINELIFDTFCWTLSESLIQELEKG